MDDLESRELVAIGSRVLAFNGHNDLIWGHASIRDNAGRGAWIKSAEWGLGEVTAERVHLLDFSGTLLAGAGSRHREYPIHTEILAARPDVGAVVHTHPPHAIALAASGQPLLPVSHSATMFVPPQVPRFTQTTDLIETPGLGQALAAALGEAPAIFLLNHGIVTVGPDLPTATVRAIILEQACQQQLLTRAAAGDGLTWTSDEEALAKRAHIFSDRSIQAAWDYLMRRLPAQS